jgi:hypothetical protein
METAMMLASEWAARAATSLIATPSRKYESIPIDRLLGDAYHRDHSVAMGHECYSSLLDATQSVSDALMARIVFPLPVSAALEINPPQLADLQGAMSEFEPPSTYLCHRTFVQYVSDFEEYRVPLEQTNYVSQHGLVMAHYTCYRDRQAREQGWEYYRAVWFEHYSEELSRGTRQ